MKKQLFSMLPYWGVTAIAFYVLPLLIKDTGSAIFILLVAIPLICLLSSAIYGVFHGFHWLYPCVVALLFVPCIFIFYNDSALIYIAAYGIIAAIGCGAGSLVQLLRNKR